MSDDLVKRLWLLDMHPESAPRQAADRIEELETKLEWVRKERDATFALTLKRAETAETKLERAVGALMPAEAYIRSDADHIAAQDGENCLEYLAAVDCLDSIRATLAAIQETPTDD